MGAAIRKRKNKVYAIRDATTTTTRIGGPPSHDRPDLIIVAPPSEKNSRPVPPRDGLGSPIAYNFLEADPDDVVLCKAQRPDWSGSDFLVFNCSGNQPSPSNGKDSGLQKCGVFFSKRSSTMGQWQINGNVLKLTWGKSRRVDSLLATESERIFSNARDHMRVDVMQPTTSPEWFKPDCLHQKYVSVDTLAENFECPICLFELWKFPAGTLRWHSRRACSHYLHVECGKHIRSLLRGTRQDTTCPTCGASYNDVKPMPDIFKDPRQWFAACDADYSGELDETEIIEGLGAVLPLARDKLAKVIRKNWRQWDKDGCGAIDLREFLDADGGLLAFIIENVRTLQRHHQERSIPSLDRNPLAWFEHWDRDGSGTLERPEVVRALVRTLCLDERGDPIMSKAHHLREVAASLWETLGYSPFEALGFEEFVRPFGLMDQILHNHTQTSYFGEDDELVLLT